MKRMVTGSRGGSRIFSECCCLSMSKTSPKQILAIMVLAACMTCVSLAQNPTPQPQQTPPADQKQDQNIPDAPSAVQPPKATPEAAPEHPELQPQEQAAPDP